MSSSGVNLEKFLIPLKEIHLATQKFSPESRMGYDGFGAIYRGQLSKIWQGRTATFKRFDPTGPGGENEFLTEVEMRSKFNHENIIAFIGYCHEGNEKIIVSEYPVNGSLDVHLKDISKRCHLTWAQRLMICIDAATGLNYLHSGLGEDSQVIHRDMKSTNISLDVNLKAKICGFGLSLLVDPNLPQVYKRATGTGSTNFYLDPIYNESGIVRVETDVYSFGVVMFEMLSGMLANEKRSIGGNQPQPLLNLVRRYRDEGLEVIIDPYLRDHINIPSFRAFTEVAYRCISWNLGDRPTMDTIIKRIQEALDIELHEKASSIRSHQPLNLEKFLIPLREIKAATGDFSPETRIAVARHGVVYKGELSPLWQICRVAIKRFGHREKNEFLAKIIMISSLQNENIQHDAKHDFSNHLQMMPNFNHENIIRFIGYNVECNEMITVSEYAMNGNLHDFLEYNLSFLTWAVRLKICIGVAKGLEYLHSGQGGAGRVIHRDMRSANILLDQNMEAKISGFGLAIFVDRNQPHDDVGVLGNQYYLDPIYNESGIVNIELDIYSFGVVMFEMLTGMLAYKRRSVRSGDEPETLISLVRRYYGDESFILIDSDKRNNIHSLRVFNKIAYRCISLNLKDRPSMKRIIKRMEQALDLQLKGSTSAIATRSLQYQNLESYLIPLKEISLATRDFSPETKIGVGGFGQVYKGQLSQRWQRCMVAIKRLDPAGHQGKKEFLTELKLISRFHHPNVIPFVGYCDEGNEMITVYEYASNRSLDYHLENSEKRRYLTWAQRLMISLGAAKGIDYLHTGLGKDKRVIHRDIKSGNILLDENMEAKICDFGLSKEGPRNQQRTKVVTQVAGTNFYLDPIYRESGILSKESDVYSFGVVLFELLSGRPAYGLTSFVDGVPQPLINLARLYHNNGPEKLIDPLIRDQIDSRCFHTFKDIAYQCISYNSGERPTTDAIIDAIEDAIDFQEHKTVKR